MSVVVPQISSFTPNGNHNIKKKMLNQNEKSHALPYLGGAKPEHCSVPCSNCFTQNDNLITGKNTLLGKQNFVPSPYWRETLSWRCSS